MLKIKGGFFMLKLVDIKKDYLSASLVTHALKGINVSFRKNEFVSILGPSGCGKTTLLNIIGGLDRYSSGDLIIKNISTKNFTDRDWDTYRNHSIGFVFQSYNLISHLTILGNVELALTIGGLPKKERSAKALKALEAVGLGDVAKKKPNQLSGGQMQRVAIARALVNDPEILLADEPTGALDSETSVQIMELLREVAKDRLVIMVTHNPELAKKYSTRIICMKDGLLTSDSMPYIEDKEKESIEQSYKKKSKMSWFTSFSLSSKNLWAKFKRTALVVVAGSIGIIGISAVLGVSYGVKSYIANMQDDMLSGNPVEITQTGLDLTALLKASSDSQIKDSISNATDKETGTINIQYMIEYLVQQQNNLSGYSIKNTITEDYVKYIDAMPKEYYSAIRKEYGINPKLNLFTDFSFTNPKGKVDSVSLEEVEKMYSAIIEKTPFGKFASMISMFTNVFYSMPDNEEYLLDQYDILNEGGYIAREKDEMMIVVSNDTALTDIFLGQVGYLSEDEFVDIIDKYADAENHKDLVLSKTSFSYDELTGKKYIYYPNDSIYQENPNKAMYELAGIRAPYTYTGELENGKSLENGVEMKITAVLRAKENVQYGSLKTGFIVSPKFEQMVLEDAKDSHINKALKEEQTYYESLPESSEDSLVKTKANYKFITPYSYSYSFRGEEKNATSYALTVFNLAGSSSGMGAFSDVIKEMFGDQYSIESQFEKAVRYVGGNSLSNDISIYPLSFNDKHYVTNYLDKWNEDVDLTIDNKVIKASDRNEIKYTDNLEVVINLINTMIEIVTIALICFTSLSLVVSTVMIGIITYVSVIERIKEIGIIRSLGGRKIDVANLFNVETFIIGASSGLFGLAVTYILCGIVNVIINNFAKVGTLMILPWNYAILVLVISILLTLISGLIPASAAAHKDPVIALRSND